MKKWIIIFAVSHLVVACACLWLGYRAAQPHREDIANVTIQPEKVVVIHRPADPWQSDCEDVRERLNCYRQFPPINTWTVKDMTAKHTVINLTTVHCESKWTQEASIPVGQQGNFRFYAGLALGGLATAGTIYGGIKLYNEIKKALK